MSRRVLTIGGLAIVAVIVGALMMWRVPRFTSRATPRAAAAASPSAPAPPGRKIKARLFYVAEDGTRLTSVERDVAYGEGTVEQARQNMEAARKYLTHAQSDFEALGAAPDAARARAALAELT